MLGSQFGATEQADDRRFRGHLRSLPEPQEPQSIASQGGMAEDGASQYAQIDYVRLRAVPASSAVTRRSNSSEFQ